MQKSATCNRLPSQSVAKCHYTTCRKDRKCVMLVIPKMKPWKPTREPSPGPTPKRSKKK